MRRADLRGRSSGQPAGVGYKQLGASSRPPTGVGYKQLGASSRPGRGHTLLPSPPPSTTYPTSWDGIFRIPVRLEKRPDRNRQVSSSSSSSSSSQSALS
eukprot:2877172-Pyramimonas_sp.AAC.1